MLIFGFDNIYGDGFLDFDDVDTIVDLSDCIITQSTGLHDDAGTEIFEGDLIGNGSGRIGEVVWFQFGGTWDVKVKVADGDPKGFAPKCWHCSVNVVGNKFECPQRQPEREEGG